jgi:hypothetical protein
MRGRNPVSPKEIIVGIVIALIFCIIIWTPGLISNFEATWPKFFETLRISGTVILLAIAFFFAFVIGVWIFAGGGRLLMCFKR